MNIFQVKALVFYSFMCSLGYAMNREICLENLVQSPETFRCNLPDDLIGGSEIVDGLDKSATSVSNQTIANIGTTASGSNQPDVVLRGFGQAADNIGTDELICDQWILDGEF